MAMTVAELMVKIDGDASGLKAATSAAEKEITSSSGRMSSAMSAAVPASTALVGGVAAAGAAFGAMTIQSVNWAGQLEQNIGGSEAVFGEWAGAIQETSTSAFSNMGLAASDYLATANKMGSLMLGSGMDTKTAMDLSSSAMQRAADVASIMGIDTSVAMESIAGAAKGNFTMMDNLGVAMNDTALNAYALEKGLGKTTQEMTQAEKIGLAMEMFMEKSAFAAGNYAKENDTFAGSFSTLKATFKDVATGLADDLLPAFTNMFKGLTNFLTDDPVGKLKELAPVFTIIGTAIMVGMLPALGSMAGAAAAAIAPLLPFLAVGAALGVIINALVEHFGGWSAVIGAVKDAWGGFTAGFTAGTDAIWEGATPVAEFGAKVRDVFDSVKTFATNLLTNLQPLWETLKASFANLAPTLDRFKAIWQDLQPIFAVVGVALGAIAAVITGVFMGALNGLLGAIDGVVQVFEGLVGIISGVVQLIIAVFTGDGQGIVDALTNIGQGIVDVFGGLWNAVSGFVTGFVDGVVDFFTGLYDTLVGHSIIPDMIDGIVEWFGQLPGRVMAFITDLVTKALTWFGNLNRDALAYITSLVRDVVTWFAGFGAKILAAVSAFPSLLLTKGRELVTGLWDGAKAVWETVSGWVGDLGDKAKSALGNVGNILYSAGSDIITGLWNGLKSVWGRVKSWFSNMKAEIPGWVKTALGIHSPSRVMMALGEQTMEGYAIGLKDMLPTIGKTMQDMTGIVSGTRFSMGTSAVSAGSRSVTVASGAIVINLPEGTPSETARAAGEGVLAALHRELSLA